MRYLVNNLIKNETNTNNMHVDICLLAISKQHLSLSVRLPPRSFGAIWRPIGKISTIIGLASPFTNQPLTFFPQYRISPATLIQAGFAASYCFNPSSDTSRKQSWVLV